MLWWKKMKLYSQNATSQLFEKRHQMQWERDIQETWTFWQCPVSGPNSGYSLCLSFITHIYSINIFTFTEHLTLKTLKNCSSMSSTITTSPHSTVTLPESVRPGPRTPPVKARGHRTPHAKVNASSHHSLSHPVASSNFLFQIFFCQPISQL